MVAKRRRGTTAPPVHNPPIDPLADVPEPPGVEVNDAFLKVLTDLYRGIERERRELAQIYGMAFCLTDVLKYSDDDDGQMHSDVASVIYRPLKDVVTNLELIKLSIPLTQEDAQKITNELNKEVEV